MSFFKNIVSKIFKPAKASTPDSTPDNTPDSTPATDVLKEVTSGNIAEVMDKVDVMAILEELASKNPQKLNWKESIVDLLKLLGLDSSLDARKKLATELNYSGDMNDSASMNIWLSKTVIAKLTEKGGDVQELVKSLY